jgi:hypothetical protein
MMDFLVSLPNFGFRILLWVANLDLGVEHFSLFHPEGIKLFTPIQKASTNFVICFVAYLQFLIIKLPSYATPPHLSH